MIVLALWLKILNQSPDGGFKNVKPAVFVQTETMLEQQKKAIAVFIFRVNIGWW